MLHTGTIIANKYRILRIIGNGGMSVVYLAEDIRSRKSYAIKDVARNGQDDSHNMVLQSLATEGNMLKQLSNPHLPGIYDIIEARDSFMLVMDYVEGKSLDIVIKERGAQTEQNIYDWGIQVCDVLEYLHSQTPPIIYRDMKPANIILQPNGNIVLIDFGTARTEKLGEELSSDTICIGTAGFAAPEQYGGFGQSDARTDIYCLGATMYNLLTGHSPCEPPEGILPLEYFSLADSPLNPIICKCTQGIPGLRYQTAAELRNALVRARAGEPEHQEIPKPAPWIRQKIKRVGEDTTGLSGLLPQENGKIPSTAHIKSDQGTSGSIQQENIEPRREPLYRKLMITSVVAAVIFLVVSGIFVWLGGRTPAVIAICLALGFTMFACINLLAIYRLFRSGHTDR